MTAKKSSAARIVSSEAWVVVETAWDKTDASRVVRVDSHNVTVKSSSPFMGLTLGYDQARLLAAAINSAIDGYFQEKEQWTRRGAGS